MIWSNYCELRFDGLRLTRSLVLSNLSVKRNQFNFRYSQNNFSCFPGTFWQHSRHLLGSTFELTFHPRTIAMTLRKHWIWRMANINRMSNILMFYKNLWYYFGLPLIYVAIASLSNTVQHVIISPKRKLSERGINKFLESKREEKYGTRLSGAF